MARRCGMFAAWRRGLWRHWSGDLTALAIRGAVERDVDAIVVEQRVGR